MAQASWSRLLGLSRSSSRGRTPRRVPSAAPAVELLEDRLAPSGGPGTSGGSGSGGPGPSSSPALVSGPTAGTIVTGSSGKTFQLGATLTALSTGGLSISQLFSGYPLAPNGGPSIQGDLVQLSNPSAVPLPMQNSTVAVVPILLTSGSGSGSYTLVMLDPTTGATYSVPVNLASAPTSTSGGP
jgi:hypothetical protein